MGRYLKTRCLIRKRIWEVDCISLDAVLATSFEWKELSNFLANHGIAVNHELPGHILEMQVQNMVHRDCHGENSLSCSIEKLLNRLYGDLICQSENMDVNQIRIIVSNVDFNNPIRLGGLFWALGSDPREEMECVRRFFHQRSQITLFQKLRFSNKEEIQ